jgi:hypothetical protein
MPSPFSLLYKTHAITSTFHILLNFVPSLTRLLYTLLFMVPCSWLLSSLGGDDFHPYFFLVGTINSSSAIMIFIDPHPWLKKPVKTVRLQQKLDGIEE